MQVSGASARRRSDFVGTPDKPNEHGAGIVKNATTKIIGKQPGDMTALREHVHLNETRSTRSRPLLIRRRATAPSF